MTLDWPQSNWPRTSGTEYIKNKWHHIGLYFLKIREFAQLQLLWSGMLPYRRVFYTRVAELSMLQYTNLISTQLFNSFSQIKLILGKETVHDHYIVGIQLKLTFNYWVTLKVKWTTQTQDLLMPCKKISEEKVLKSQNQLAAQSSIISDFNNRSSVINVTTYI